MILKYIFKAKNYIPPIVRCISTTKPLKRPIRSGVTLVFHRYLLVTNIVSCGILMLIGDLCQQELEYRQKKLSQRYDYLRAGRMLLVGLAMGPVHHYFYLYLGKLLPARNITSVMKKIAADQFIMSPCCIVTFFYTMGALELKPFKEWNEELKNKFIEVYQMDWFVWPPTQFINFYFVPLKFQVFYINLITMLYNIFLSYIKHR